ELTGMALREISSVPVEISLMPDVIKKHKALQKKKPYFYASAISIILCLLVFYWVVSTKRDYDKGCVEKVLAEVEKTEKISGEVRSVAAKLAGAQGRYNKAIEMANKRSQWVNVLNELQSILPDKWWLTSLTASSDKQEKARVARRRTEDLASASMFDAGPTRGRSSGPVKNVELKWLKLTGHSVVLGSDLLLEDVFKKRLKASKYFDAGSDFDSYEISKGENNFITFEIQIKLKTPIKK
ncbi:MAG: hypothetical protein WCS27_04760, partial [Victivallaceae bacterium]